jgi:hypothetical protein
MSKPSKNPYPRKRGFSLRVANAGRALRRLGHDCLANIYTRGFDSCFEMHDGSAVVWALMHQAIERQDSVLERGIRNMGVAVWPQWLEVYEQRGKYATTSLPDLFQPAMDAEPGRTLSSSPRRFPRRGFDEA